MYGFIGRSLKFPDRTFNLAFFPYSALKLTTNPQFINGLITKQIDIITKTRCETVSPNLCR